MQEEKTLISRLDHLVLTVRDPEAAVEFYTQTLGMRAEERAGRRSLHFGRQKINLHEAGKEFEPKATHPTPGSADLCFITGRELEEVSRRLVGCGVEIEEGPVERTGALGKMMSIYFRDPDGNLLEVSKYIERQEGE